MIASNATSGAASASITDNISNRFAADARSLNDLRESAKQNSPEAIKASAKQFEALFVNMMMKSMRDATPQDGPLDSEQSKTFTAMLDQQLSQKIASRGLGLAEVLERQMAGVNGLTPPPIVPFSARPGASVGGLDLNSASSLGIPDSVSVDKLAKELKVAAPELSSSQAHVRIFQDKLAAYADDASQATGLPAKFMLGQAALESGWGKHEITGADGQPSHNLFGIKAGGKWTGRVVSAVTTEYVNGVPTRKVEKFRAYDNYADAFKDYANLLKGNQRYQNVLANARDAVGFAQGLQKAGYATDPHYAEKITRVISKSLAV